MRNATHRWSTCRADCGDDRYEGRTADSRLTDRPTPHLPRQSSQQSTTGKRQRRHSSLARVSKVVSEAHDNVARQRLTGEVQHCGLGGDSIRGAVWSAANRLHGQRTGDFSWRPVLRYSQGSTLPRATHMEGRVIGCYRPLHLALAMSSGVSRHATNLLYPACIPPTTSIPASTQLTIAMTNYTHAPTVTNLSAFHVSSSASKIILIRLW